MLWYLKLEQIIYQILILFYDPERQKSISTSMILYNKIMFPVYKNCSCQIFLSVTNTIKFFASDFIKNWL